MIAVLEVQYIRYRAAAAVFYVISAEINLWYPRVDYRSRTHRTGLEGDVQLTLPKPPAAQSGTGGVYRLYLGVAKGVFRLFAAVSSAANYLAFSNDYRAYRYFAGVESLSRER